MKKLIRLSGCLFLVISGGCCFFPLPTEPTLEMRNEITSKQVSFITPGSTHREDVIRQLGEPYVEFPDLRIIAYTWVMRVGKVSGCIVGAGGPGVAAGDIRDLYRYHSLLIAFDSADRVVKFENMSSWGNSENVREQALKLLESLKGQGLANLKGPPMLVGQVIPPGESALYIYWQPGFWNNSPFGGSWEIGVDGKIVGWLRNGEYLGIVLTPAAHAVSVYYFSRDVKRRTDTRTYFEALRGQAHYVSVGEPQLATPPLPVLTVHPEGEALPVLKKMKPMP